MPPVIILYFSSRVICKIFGRFFEKVFSEEKEWFMGRPHFHYFFFFFLTLSQPELQL